MFETVQDFIEALERAGELRRIRARVSPVLEIAEIADRVSKSPAPHPPSDAARRNDPRFHLLGGRALLFENVEGSDFPLLINAYGSYRRTEMALGCHEPGPGTEGGPTPGGYDAIGARIGELVKPEPPRSPGEALAKARQFAPLLRIGPKRVRQGRCQEVVVRGEDVDLGRLPLIRCWPDDGDPAALGYPPGVNAGVEGVESGSEWEHLFRGRYVTFAGIHTIHADDAGAAKQASHNIGMYRVQMLGRRTMAMHWHVHHDGAAHWRSWKRLGEPMPVAIVFGGESVLPYAATAPLPPGISELLLAGFLNGRGIRMVRAKTVPLWVPANAEIVIEGYVSPEAGEIGWDPRDPDAGPLGPGAVFEGPFGDHTGFYSMPDRYPRLDVTAVTHRRSAVLPATIVGLPPQEDYALGKATERVFLPLLKTIIHDIEDYDLPMFGAFHNCAFIRIRKQYPLQARRVMHAVWGAGQMAWTKTIFVVDEDADVHDTFEVLRRALMHCEPGRDTAFVRGPLDILDHAAPWVGAGTKIGFDCTRRWPGEEAGCEGPATGEGRALPDEGEAAEIEHRASGVEGVAAARVLREATGWLLVTTDRRGREACEGVIRGVWGALGERCPPFVVLLGEDVGVADADRALFHWVANMDPGRDTVLEGGRIGFDSTPKERNAAGYPAPVRAWPTVLEMSAEVRALVDGRWGEYGVG